jgi:hypothetical protein
MEKIYDEMGYLIEVEDDGYRKHYVCNERINDILTYKDMRKDDRAFQMHIVRTPHHGQSFDAFE